MINTLWHNLSSYNNMPTQKDPPPSGQIAEQIRV